MNHKTSCESLVDFLLPALLILFLIYCYYTEIVSLCVFSIRDDEVKKWMYIVISHILLALFLWSYFGCLFKTHAPIPAEYKLSGQEHDKLIRYTGLEINDILKKLIKLRGLQVWTCGTNGTVRYCSTCKHIKPDRAHHCSTCGRCILKMDHHCPWVGNCVGYSNYKQFVLVLFYGTLLSAFYLGTMLEFTLQLVFNGSLLDDYSKHLDKLIGMFMTVAAVLTLLILLSFHVRLVCLNESTLESMRDISFIDSRHEDFEYKYCSNFLAIFGSNCFLWGLPIDTTSENGYEFEVQ